MATISTNISRLIQVLFKIEKGDAKAHEASKETGADSTALQSTSSKANWPEYLSIR